LALVINHYRANAIKYKKQRDESYQELGLANKTILDMQARQRDVAALDARYTKELTDAKARLSDFEQCVRDGKCGLRINAACQKGGTPISASMDDATGPRLTDSAQRDYFVLRHRIATSNAMIRGLQDYIENVCLIN